MRNECKNLIVAECFFRLYLYFFLYFTFIFLISFYFSQCGVGEGNFLPLSGGLVCYCYFFRLTKLKRVNEKSSI